MHDNDHSKVHVKYKDNFLELSAPGLLFLMACCIIGIVIIEMIHGYSTTILILGGAIVFLSLLFYYLQLFKRVSDEVKENRKALREVSDVIQRISEANKVDQKSISESGQE